MKNSVNLKNLALWLSIMLLTIGALYLTYSFEFSSPVRVIIWIIWFIMSTGFAYFTTQGEVAFSFAKEAKVELLKVVWPTRHETIQKTTIVMAMVIATSFLLWGIDTLMMWVIAKITHLG